MAGTPHDRRDADDRRRTGVKSRFSGTSRALRPSLEPVSPIGFARGLGYYIRNSPDRFFRIRSVKIGKSFENPLGRSPMDGFVERTKQPPAASICRLPNKDKIYEITNAPDRPPVCSSVRRCRGTRPGSSHTPDGNAVTDPEGVARPPGELVDHPEPGHGPRSKI